MPPSAHAHSGDKTSTPNHQQPIRSKGQGSTFNDTPEGRRTPVRKRGVAPVRKQRRPVVAEVQERHVVGAAARPDHIHIVVVQHLAEHHRVDVPRPQPVAEPTCRLDIGLRD